VRYLPLIIVVLLSFAAKSQVDTGYLKALYDRCLDFDESKIDSIGFYANFIEKESKKISYVKGPVLSLRLKGLQQEFRSDYKAAIDYYLQSLDEARRIKQTAYEISALSDLAITYYNIGRAIEAKKFYLQCASLAVQTNEIHTVVTSYNNLGVIYNELGEHDSALVFLNEALIVGQQAPGKIDHSGTYNNMGNAYFKKKQYDRALYFFKSNYRRHIKDSSDLTSLWTDHINLADVYIELKNYDSARFHADRAMFIAEKLGSKRKEADSYSILAKLNERTGNFQKAYQYLTKWYMLDTAMVNGTTQSTIAELQERFNAKEREAENKLLLERIETERYRNRSVTYLAVALGIIGILIAIAFITKRNANRRLTTQNEMIRRQNERLAELNHEKNTLISIVSHDLGTPFATIQMWSQVLQDEADSMNGDQRKAVERINQAGSHGQQLIQRILDVETANRGDYKLRLENFDINLFIESVVDGFRPAAAHKEINLQTDSASEAIYVLSDKQLLLRILDNLISNAIKYSPRGRTVWVNISDEADDVHIRVRDEGLGISKEEIPFLFSKYTRLSSRPTNGEPSTGLGLSIVKRIVDELNGKIYCESEPGKGSLFTVVLKK
jgi:signal transduction histidine kinase